jgi:chromosome segregation ATPase
MFGKKRIQELESKLYEADDNISKLTREKTDLEERLNNIVVKATATTDELASVSTKLSDAEEALSKLESYSTDLSYQLKTIQEKYSALEQNLSDSEAEKASLQECLEVAESKNSELQEKLSAATANNEDLEQKLGAAYQNISELEAKLCDTDFEALKEQERVTLVELEGLRELYTKKIQDFDNSIEERQEAIEKENSIQRYNLEKEIEEDRQANQEYVSNTVKEFGESFNYYLDQVKVLMNALSHVATKTGENLFKEKEKKLKTILGEAVAEEISGEALDPDGVVLIKGSKEKWDDKPSIPEGEGSDPCC